MQLPNGEISSTNSFISPVGACFLILYHSSTLFFFWNLGELLFLLLDVGRCHCVEPIRLFGYICGCASFQAYNSLPGQTAEPELDDIKIFIIFPIIYIASVCSNFSFFCHIPALFCHWYCNRFLCDSFLFSCEWNQCWTVDVCAIQTGSPEHHWNFHGTAAAAFWSQVSELLFRFIRRAQSFS